MKKYFPVMMATFIWIWPPIIIRALSFYFDNFSQNFYRFLAASVVLIIINLIYYKEKFLKGLRNIGRFILPTALIFVFQTTWVWGLSIIAPTLAVLITRSSILFVILFSFLLFKDERKIIKSRAFILGSLLATIGVVGVITGRDDLYLNDSNLGILLMLMVAILWALYLLVMKKRVEKTEPLVAAGIIYTLSVPLFFVSSLFWGNLSDIYKAPLGINILLFVSGVLGVGIANAFNFKSIKLVGTVISSTFVLLAPFFTGIASYFIFQELLTIPQILSGVILIVGCLVLLRTKGNSHISQGYKK